MAISIMRSKGQITLPQEIREAARLEEGDAVKVEVTEEGVIILRPQKMVDASQAWFWTPEWQAGEAQADADIAAGRVTRHGTDEEFLASLGDD
jgi:AbrB family looped-hinge helix DNA binding protein